MKMNTTTNNTKEIEILSEIRTSEKKADEITKQANKKREEILQEAARKVEEENTSAEIEFAMKEYRRIIDRIDTLNREISVRDEEKIELEKELKLFKGGKKWIEKETV